jgi:hypothetical protein
MNMSMPNPPAVPQTLLHLLLPVERRESVVGDLLEEYRDSRVPSMGRCRANLWYWKQVFGFWQRAYWAFVAPLFGLFALRHVLTVFPSPSGIPYFNVDFLFGLVTLSPFVFLLTGAYGSWRTERWAGGIVASLGTFIAAWLLIAAWWNTTLYPFALIQQSNPYWIHAWQSSLHRTQVPSLFWFHPDTPSESFLRWAFWGNVAAQIVVGASMLASAIVGGGIGSTLGRMTPRRPSGHTQAQG